MTTSTLSPPSASEAQSTIEALTTPVEPAASADAIRSLAAAAAALPFNGTSPVSKPQTTAVLNAQCSARGSRSMSVTVDAPAWAATYGGFGRR